MQKIIEIVNGVTRHPDRRMAEPVSLILEDGQQVAIVGSNGSGKSRLVDIIVGRYPLLGDEVHYDFTPSIHRLACENIQYITFRDTYGEGEGAGYYQQRWNQHDMNEENALLSLSSGELRRYQLKKRLEQKPRVLIIDNPFIGLDVEARHQLTETLTELTHTGNILVVLVLSKTDDIPPFITHIVPVENMKIMPMTERQHYQAPSVALPALPQAERQWIQELPQKDIRTMPFYPQNGGEILKFNAVSLRYGSRTILKDLCWTVNEGERWALSGENGAGKSALLSLVCADNPQSYACDFELFGHKRGSGESIWEIKRHIGYVSPEMHRAYRKDIPALDIVGSGLNDSVGLYTRLHEDQKQVCLDWMKVFGIEQLAERPYLRLSSGEQRLCLLARAFVKDPELLILDEPLHGLDETNRQRTREIIDTFCQRKNKTLVMVTHYEEELPSCITHSIQLKKNK